MELIEKPNLRAIHYLNSITYDDFTNDCITESKRNGDKPPAKKDLQTWYSVLRSYINTTIKTKGHTKRIYSHSQNTPAGVGGRLFCANSLQGIWGKYRGVLMDGIGTDIDMANAHPVILRYVCNLHNIDCPNLEYYINNRKKCLSEFENRNLGKKTYLIATNTDKHTRDTKLPQSFKNYDKEMKQIQKKIIDLPEYTALYDTIPEYKKQTNYNGCAINRVMCYYENIILQHALHFINTKGLEVAILMFDGLMAYGNHYENQHLLDELTAYVENQMPNLNMKWAYKPHDTDIIIPDEFDESQYEVCDEVSGVFDDMEAVKKLFELYPHWVCCNNDLYVFDDDTGMWNSDKTNHYKIIQRYTAQLFVLVFNKEGEKIRTTKSYGNTLSLMEKIPPLIRMLCVNNNWLNSCANSSLGKILFENGYYDFHKEVFYSKEEHGFSPDIVFMAKISHSFSQFYDEDIIYMKDIQQRFFTDPLGKEMGEYLMTNLARGLAGDVMKRILFGLGGTDCGKSVLTKALVASCGEYVGSFNAENLSQRTTGSDEAQQMRWAYLLRFKRIILSNEIKTGSCLDGNIIKKNSSGGDKLIGRLHGGLEQSFTPHYLAVCFANDLPKIKPYDDALDERLKVIGYNRRFVDEPTNEFEKKKDFGIEKEIETERFQRCFIGLLINSYMDKSKFTYEPADVIISKSNWVQVDKNVVDTFKNDYEITNDPNHFVKSADIEQWIKSKDLGITMMKFSNELKKYAILNKHDCLINKNKKVNGKTHMYWFGVRLIVETFTPEYTNNTKEEIEYNEE